MVNNLEGYAEYAVQKKLKAKDRMPVVASAALMVVGLAIMIARIGNKIGLHTA